MEELFSSMMSSGGSDGSSQFLQSMGQMQGDRGIASILNQAGGLFETRSAIHANRLASMMQKNRLNMQAMWQDLQGQNIETTALAQSNAIREQLMRNIASTNAAFAGKGFDISGADRINIESRRQAMGDVLTTTAQGRLGAIQSRLAAQRSRADARISSIMGRAQRAGMRGQMWMQGADLYNNLQSQIASKMMGGGM